MAPSKGLDVQRCLAVAKEAVQHAAVASGAHIAAASMESNDARGFVAYVSVSDRHVRLAALCGSYKPREQSEFSHTFAGSADTAGSGDAACIHGGACLSCCPYKALAVSKVACGMALRRAAQICTGIWDGAPFTSAASGRHW